jgi:uncharacterized repeat protein (TIGR02543 family)
MPHTAFPQQLPYPTRPNISGRAVVWGRDLDGQTNIPTNAFSGVCAVVGQNGINVALKTNGSLVIWGQQSSSVPVQISGQPFSQTTNAVMVKVNNGSLGILSSNGKLVVQSNGNFKTNLVISNVVDFGLGWNHRIVLKNDRSVETYSDPINRDISYYYDFSFTNIPLEARTNVIKVTSGYLHVGAINSSGKVIIWGPDYPDWGGTPKNVPAEAQSNVVNLAIGYWHALALKNNGQVIAWGNTNGGLCDVPTEVQGNVLGLVADESHSSALLNDGRIIVWGGNDYGQQNVPSDKRFSSIGGWGQAVYAVNSPFWFLSTTVNNTNFGAVTTGGYKNENSIQEIQANAGPGYVFFGWSGDATGSSNPIFVAIDNNKNIVANFSPDLSDNDADGLSNYDEIIIHSSNPNQTDSNLDGITDPQAVGLGYSPAFHFGPLLGFLRTNNTSANSLGLYTTNQIMDLKFGGIVLHRTNNQLSLTYEILQSSNLVNWTTNRQETVTISNPPASKMFLRINPKQ